ncbi:AAA family ATPase [Methylomonas sp. SURF-2]|uniref:AAA family ATPase n=1 Tax=Methylomonas subterranea TaxID=2952225 RepID=A0ABT1TDY0_9GAMM|nr:ATP-binding protein [Methylomonas sp. SURF-2]MCQ8103662.1 AAA family ATPase [Methylomonas sp. SURF-2]
MINSVQLKNFGPLTELDWQNLGPINLVIGNNGCGKSFLLKAIYSAVRTLEDYKRGDNPDRPDHILLNKLFWTFQAEGVGNLISRTGSTNLSFGLTLDGHKFSYQLTKPFRNAIDSWVNDVPPRKDNSIFLPSKEILSFYHVILKSRQQDQVLGFDDTYLDLARALQISPEKDFMDAAVREIWTKEDAPKSGCGSWDFQKATSSLKGLIGGKINYDETTNRWYFEQEEFDKKERYAMGATAEGIRKIAVFDRLLRNGYLNEKSIIFIDEPESTLHPEAISTFLDIIAILAKHGIQFFLASHSYAVVKKLSLIARQQQLSIPVLSKEGDDWVQTDLLHDMPDNPIINESIRLYEEEVDLAFQ